MSFSDNDSVDIPDSLRPDVLYETLGEAIDAIQAYEEGNGYQINMWQKDRKKGSVSPLLSHCCHSHSLLFRDCCASASPMLPWKRTPWS